ncbi:sigma-70 family RNA polymerase sigma factor [candidate division KSB3 bacterium]|uniref:Sigma-70 family RNA polymerase sigma factor n=1 Tax=candidate division KSB3 bacterium TaxID=2044937 RepID=A0A9D5K026_9BACT|nr:sigma-70 family RNA polymerase sigma factor [candidate division KSB3 bacterium]MBD3326936.1 sigma-70 family RNA polymerase sigma factor [candidate division KSB3 bacterium]
MTILDNLRHSQKFGSLWNLSTTLMSNDSGDVNRSDPEETAQTQIPDEELVSASQRGDTQAFEVLILRYQRQIFSLIYQMTRDVEVVEDIGQDVFVAAFRAIKDFKGRSSFFTWLYRIAINHCKNYLTSTNRTQDAEQRYRKEQGADVTGEYQERNPQNMLLAKEFVQQMEDAIASLPPEQRIVLTLCEFQGLSYQEMADILECPIGTVRSRLSRARTALQNIIGDYL